MKSILKRLSVIVLALALLGSVMLPPALAAGEAAPVPKGSRSIGLYAGCKSTLTVYRNNVAQSASLYRWKSSRSSVVSVNSRGEITGMKTGSATITATRKSDGTTSAVCVNIWQNKVDNINRRPAVSVAPYKGAKLLLKSVEIASPTKVVAEYWLPINFPSGWRASGIEFVSDAINLYNKTTQTMEKTIVGGAYQTRSSKITGFRVRNGGFVQLITVTYTGSQVNCAGIRLAKYRVRNSLNAYARIAYYH